MLEQRTFRLALAVAALALALGSLPAADAQQAGGATPPIYFVDPDEVLAGMVRKNDLEADLNKLAAEYGATLKQLENERAERRAALDIWPAHTTKWWEETRKVAALTAQIDFDKKFFDEALQQKRMQNTFDLYNDIIEAVTQVAKGMKPQPIVLRCSKKSQVGGSDSTNLTIEQFTMSFRTVLYFPSESRLALDKTREVMEHVNREYAKKKEAAKAAEK